MVDTPSGCYLASDGPSPIQRLCVALPRISPASWSIEYRRSLGRKTTNLLTALWRHTGADLALRRLLLPRGVRVFPMSRRNRLQLGVAWFSDHTKDCADHEELGRQFQFGKRKSGRGFPFSIRSEFVFRKGSREIEVFIQKVRRALV